MAIETRAKAVSIAERFGYLQDDADDIAQDVMLKLWSLHEQLNDVTVYDNGELTYGVTTRPNPQYNGGWLSACDFIIERVDE